MNLGKIMMVIVLISQVFGTTSCDAKMPIHRENIAYLKAEIEKLAAAKKSTTKITTPAVKKNTNSKITTFAKNNKGTIAVGVAGVIVAGTLAYLAYNNPDVVVNGLNSVKTFLFGKVAQVVQPTTPASQIYGKMYAQNLFRHVVKAPKAAEMVAQHVIQPTTIVETAKQAVVKAVNNVSTMRAVPREYFDNVIDNIAKNPSSTICIQDDWLLKCKTIAEPKISQATSIFGSLYNQLTNKVGSYLTANSIDSKTFDNLPGSAFLTSSKEYIAKIANLGIIKSIK